MYKLHKWIAVTAGSFLLLWLISGIVMVVPQNFFHVPFRPQQTAPIDLQQVTLSPAEALSHLSKTLDDSPGVRSVRLRKIAHSVVYEINLARGESYLIEARSGQLLTITPASVEQIARYYVPSQASVLEIEPITQHSYSYPWGPVPAFRIMFDNDNSTAYYVSARDGSILRSNRWSRILGAIESLHRFEPLKLVTRREGIRKGLLILLSLVGVAAAATGYYLALPNRRS